jgi:hypothetical protein
LLEEIEQMNTLNEQLDNLMKQMEALESLQKQTQQLYRMHEILIGLGKSLHEQPGSLIEQGVQLNMLKDQWDRHADQAYQLEGVTERLLIIRAQIKHHKRDSMFFDTEQLVALGLLKNILRASGTLPGGTPHAGAASDQGARGQRGHKKRGRRRERGAEVKDALHRK